jgi:hypothetical protein
MSEGPDAVALVHAGLGDAERAFAFLDAAYRERSHWLVWVKRDPRWHDLRPICVFGAS